MTIFQKRVDEVNEWSVEDRVAFARELMGAPEDEIADATFELADDGMSLVVKMKLVHPVEVVTFTGTIEETKGGEGR